ncbi:hypothetical protein [Poritiphilus flavus]|uniref:DUF998 domain-containing protein n=1 Tax=Poritiphilus flavus TaxID=2697053 RepID=A0A6L9ECE1_9FLAO|nr:hypothetical protein [Poritiphilus flavus]NAS12271.1 hypothetical protein [Poritiphilus flavus]
MLVFRKNRVSLALLPLTGMLLFILLYIIAAIRYPGGSHSNPYHEGFSFWHNYLCDLLDTYSVGGVLNSARVFARLALLVLCLSLVVFWYNLPRLFELKNINQRIMQSSGMLASIIILFLAAGNHDIIVRIAGALGVVALISSFIELYRIRYRGLFYLGVFCLLIFFVNYYIYETGIYIKALPVIQKITFASFILWFISLDISIYQIEKSRNRNTPI